MATIMSWGNSKGTKGRCDAKCHNAAGTRCRCMCGGRFHGAAHQPGGIQGAVRKHWNEVFDEAMKQAQEHGMELKSTPYQLSLLAEA